ncbi:MAG: DNA polymerase III subunit chi [Gammaproteobacteria bacterium]|nr:DNA polymerase III subunit chi [Gammaproteobacteria bacterium]
MPAGQAVATPVTRVDFYILGDDSDAQAADTIACRLAGKAFGLGHAVYLHAASVEHAQRLDQLLWTFQQGSFVPHVAAQGWQPPVDGLPTPVLLGYDEPPEAEPWDLLINTAGSVPLFFSRYARVAELVPGESAARQLGRERYQFYRERGYELHTHKL